MSPNVIVIVLDAARRDALEPYGAPAGATPVIAQLAGRGKALDEVYSSACWTAPSHGSFFTGKLPRALGLAGVPGGRPPDVAKQLAPERERMLPVVFGEHGYRTLLASANLWVSPHAGFDAGVDEFFAVNSGRQSRLESRSLRDRLGRWTEAVRARADDGAAEIERRLFGRLTGGREPFFCFVNLVESHSPYLAPRPFAVGGPIERIRASDDAARYFTLESIWKTCLGGMTLAKDAELRLRRQYAASIRAMDAWLGRLLEVLDTAGRLEETLVVVTSDHGENLGDGGLIAHGLSLDNRLIHVPFVLAGPWSRTAEPTSLAGLPRFLAESAGLGKHPWGADELPSGVGIAQFDPVIDRDDPKAREVVIGDWGLDERALVRFTTPLTCAVSGRRKLLLEGDNELWIDLDENPLELSPIPASDAPAADQGELERLRAALRHPGAVASRPWGEGEIELPAEELERLEERMRLLGYM